MQTGKWMSYDVSREANRGIFIFSLYNAVRIECRLIQNSGRNDYHKIIVEACNG